MNNTQNVTVLRSGIAEQPPTATAPVRRNWPPMNLPFDLTTSHQHWLTRGARGITWHRSGLVSQEPLR